MRDRDRARDKGLEKGTTDKGLGDRNRDKG